MKLAFFVTFYLGDVQIENLSFDSEENLLYELSSPRELLAALNRLTSLLVCSPVVSLASLAAVVGTGGGDMFIAACAPCATSGGRLSTGRAHIARCSLRALHSELCVGSTLDAMRETEVERRCGMLRKIEGRRALAGGGGDVSIPRRR